MRLITIKVLQSGAWIYAVSLLLSQKTAVVKALESLTHR